MPPMPTTFKAAGLTRRDVRDLAAYLFDGASQSTIARRCRQSKATVGRRLRAAIGRLERAGFNVPRPEERCSRPRWMPAAHVLRTIDPGKLDRFTADPAGLIAGRCRRYRDRADTIDAGE